jgi:hypothetical protein
MAIDTTTTLHLRSSVPPRPPRPLARQLVTMFRWFSRVRRRQAADNTPSSKPRPPPPTLHHTSIDDDIRSHANDDDTIETKPVCEWRLHHSRQLTPAAADQHRRARQPDHKPDPRASSKLEPITPCQNTLQALEEAAEKTSRAAKQSVAERRPPHHGAEEHLIRAVPAGRPREQPMGAIVRYATMVQRHQA